MPSVGNIVLPQTEKVGVIYTSDGPINDSWWCGDRCWNWFYIIVVAILVIIVIMMLCYLMYRLSCSSTPSPVKTSVKTCAKEKATCARAVTKEENVYNIPERYIKEYRDVDGLHRYEYKIDKAIYEPASQPGVREVKEYNSVPMTTPASPKEVVIKPIVAEKVSTPSLVPSMLPTSLPASTTATVSPAVKSVPQYDTSVPQVSSPAKNMGMEYYGTSPIGDSLYTLKSSNTPRVQGYKSPLDLLKQQN